MKISNTAAYAMILGMVGFTSFVMAQSSEKTQPPKDAASAPADANKTKSDKALDPNRATPAPIPTPRASAPGPALSFLPPAPGTPIRREGGATRGGGDARELALSVIAPEQAGWSSIDQPELYWFTSRPASNAIFLTINPASGNAIDPLYEGSITATVEGGIQVIALKKLGVKLTANTDYEWSVSLVNDPKSPSRDLVASGRIRYVPLAADARAAIDRASATEQAESLARSGYWYDVVRMMRERFPASAAEIGLYESAGLARIARYLRAGS